MTALLKIGDCVWFHPRPETDAPGEPTPDKRVGTVYMLFEARRDGSFLRMKSVPWAKARFGTIMVQTTDNTIGHVIAAANKETS